MAPQVDRELNRRVRLTYLQSVQVVEGDRPSEDFVNVGTDFSPLAGAKPKNPRKRERIEEILSTKFGEPQSFQNRRASDTGWSITGSANEVDWSKVAYRIGIREVGLNSFQFAEVSSIVSVPIESPKPIWKIAMRARELIPASYDPQTAWIQYHVTVDDGQTWLRINPLDKPTRFEKNGAIVPRTLTINAEKPTVDPETMDLRLTEPVKRVRMRYTLFSDQNRPDANLVSPVIRGVQVLLYPRGGLSGALSQESQ